MKLSNILSAICLLTVLVFSACTKDSSVEQLPLKESNIALQVSTVNEEGEILKTETTTKFKGYASPNLETRGNPNQITTGDYTRGNGSTVDLSAILNKSGVHGEEYVNSVIYGHIHSETVGVSTNAAGESIIALRILSIERPGGAYQVNNIFFYKVKDNGEGANSQRDQYSSLALVFTNWFNLYSNPQDFMVAFPASNFYNHLAFATMLNITEGQIQVR